MASNVDMVSHRTRNWVLGLLILAWSSRIHGLAITYCSPDLTGDFTPVFNTWQSNGACQTTCEGQYAFAVMKGPNCWCSDYIPADQTSTYDCNTQCPGFPNDWCGNDDKGLYGYYQLSGKAPSGTAGGPSPTPGSSTKPSRVTPSPTEAYTSVTTVTGQVRTVVITPTPSSDSTLGSGTQINSSGGGVSTGKVVGIVLGVALGLGVIIGLGVWFYFRRRHQRNSGVTPLDDSSTHGGNNIPSRQVSQMSSAGLLGKVPRILTTGLPSGSNPRSAGADTFGSNLDRRSVGTDQRLNPYAIYAHDESRHSNVSLQDNQDYSRQLRVANPDP